MISSPIVGESGYGGPGGAAGGARSWSATDQRPKPRVRPEAEEYANRAQGSIAQLLLTGQPVYRPPTRSKKEAKDFTSGNVRKMRQVQAMNRRRRKEEAAANAKPVKVLPQSEKYQQATSKVAEKLKQGAPASRPASTNYLRAHSRTGGSRARSASPGPRPSSAVTEVDVELTKPTNYIAHNAKLSRKYKPPRPPSAIATEANQEKKNQRKENYKKGEIPKYLQVMQAQWKREEEERIRNIPDPDMPPGHRMMPTEERLKTLEILAQKEKEIQSELYRLPLAPETLRAKSRKAQVEKQLAEVEEAQKIFSRSKVFVRIDG